jgi:hypothetical protein
MTDGMPAPKSSARREIIGFACFSFSTGMMLTTAMMYVAKGDEVAWLYAACAVLMLRAAFVMGRRTLRKVP